jgi:hypothetical protein
MPEFQAHQSSYDHQHKQRLKDMKQMSKDPNAAANARKAEEAEKKKMGIISIKITGDDKPVKKGGFKKLFGGSGNTGGESKVSDGERKPGFKKVFGGDNEGGRKEGVIRDPLAGDGDVRTGEEWEGDEGIWNEGDPGYEYYDPSKPTGCRVDCPCHQVGRSEGKV